MLSVGTLLEGNIPDFAIEHLRAPPPFLGWMSELREMNCTKFGEYIGSHQHSPFYFRFQI